MSDIKQGVVRWQGANNFTGTSGSGFEVAMGAGAEAHGASPMEMVLLALGGCTAVDVVSMLQKQRQQLQGLEVRVAGQRREAHPRVYEEVTVTYIVTGHQLDREAVARAIRLSEEKYCSVSAMVGALGRVVTQIEIREGAETA